MPLRQGAKVLWVLVLTAVLHTAFAQVSTPPPEVPPPRLPQTRVPDLPIETPELTQAEEAEEPSSWLDTGHRNLHTLLWRSAMGVDRWFGGDMPAHAYADQTRGSITPILLWDEFDGFDPKLRFRVRMPMPYIDERVDAFVGTFTRDEFVTEREQPSGAIPRQHAGGRTGEDETLIGIQYRERREREQLDSPGGEFEADTGIRIRSPIDPFVKAGYRYTHYTDEGLRIILRETAFWQNSEQFGLTSRIDLEHLFDWRWLESWFGRFTASATISQKSDGVRGFVAFTMHRTLPHDRAIAAQVFNSAEFDADVPVEEYGIRVAFRQRLARDWLVVEVRPSLTWPKDDPGEPRKPSWGIGVGFEMFFGMDEFQGRPVTF